MNLLEIGKQVRLRRRELKLTQAQLAQSARIARSTLNALENGQLAELGTNRLLNVLDALGMVLSVSATKPERPTLDSRYAEQAAAARNAGQPPRFRG